MDPDSGRSPSLTRNGSPKSSSKSGKKVNIDIEPTMVNLMMDYGHQGTSGISASFLSSSSGNGPGDIKRVPGRVRHIGSAHHEGPNTSADVRTPQWTCGCISFRMLQNRKAKQTFSVKNQIVLATELKPRRFRTTLQNQVFDGTTARQDAVRAKRNQVAGLLGRPPQEHQVPHGEPLA